MTGLRPTFQSKHALTALTFKANVNIPGGKFVEPDSTTGRIKVAVAESAVVLGLAVADASAPGYAASNTTDAWGNVTTPSHVAPPNEVAVCHQGVFELLAVGAIAFGARITVATNGDIKTATGTMPIYGICVEPGGIANGARGRIKLMNLGVV